MRGEEQIGETREAHLVRFFFPRELELFLETTGFRLCRSDAFGRVGEKIRAMKSWHDTEPRQSPAAHAQACLGHDEIRANVIARFGPHDLARVRFRILKGVVAAKTLACFDQHHGPAMFHESLCHESAGWAGADDDHVKCLREFPRCGRTGEHPGMMANCMPNWKLALREVTVFGRVKGVLDSAHAGKAVEFQDWTWSGLLEGKITETVNMLVMCVR